MSSLLDIVICTYNRAELLQKNLDRLLPLVEKEPGVAVLVVDNNSPDNTAEALRDFQCRHPALRVVSEAAQGLSHARNRGIRESSAEWIAYLDDDARVYPDWLSRALKVLEANDFDCFGGVFLPWYYYPGKPHWFPEESASNKHTQMHYGELPANAFPCGGNFFCRRNLLTQLNGFDPSLGMNGVACGYGEETDLVARLRRNNARIGFVPDLLVDHCVMPVKYTMRRHFDSNFAKGKISWKLTGKRPTAGKTAVLVLSLPFIALRDAVRGVVRLAREGKLTPQTWFFFVGSRVAMRLGRIAGCFSKD